MTLENKKHLSDMLVSWIGVIGVITAGVWSINEYIDNGIKNRTQETLKYVHIFNSGEMFKAQRNVASRWNKEAGKIKALREAGDEEALADFVVSVASKEEMFHDIWLIIDFFESLATCVSQSLCEKNSALSFFGDRAKRFYLTHYHYIEEVKELSEDYNYAKKYYEFVAMYYSEKKNL